MAARRESDTLPDEFRQAVQDLGSASMRPEVQVEQVPAPQRVAPYSAALSAEVVVDDMELATGRLVLLHDPDGHEAWQGTYRCVAYVRADMDPEMAADPLLATVAWSWLIESLESNGADYLAPSGTVTRVANESFGGMADEPPRAEIELRASWTPVGTAAGPSIATHAAAWGRLLCTAAGLPPTPAGVVAIPSRRGSAR
ncbi:DUF3000 domain-containing protein [Flindersiella endophytica]